MSMWAQHMEEDLHHYHLWVWTRICGNCCFWFLRLTVTTPKTPGQSFCWYWCQCLSYSLSVSNRIALRSFLCQQHWHYPRGPFSKERTTNCQIMSFGFWILVEFALGGGGGQILFARSFLGEFLGRSIQGALAVLNVQGARRDRRCCAVHLFQLYPKYHCECNWIKRYWSAAKKEARRECDYTFKSLDKNISAFLDSVCPPEEGTPSKIRRYFHKSFAYIQAYSEGHTAIEAFQIVKEFSNIHKSHRKLRLNQ